MKVIVCGSRHWKNKTLIREVLGGLPKGTLIIHGACRGADLIAQEVAKELNLPYHAFPAKWKQYGKSAGPIRNRQMLKMEPDLVIAFHKSINSSKGTKDMLTAAKKAKVPYQLYWKNRGTIHSRRWVPNDYARVEN